MDLKVVVDGTEFEIEMTEVGIATLKDRIVPLVKERSSVPYKPDEEVISGIIETLFKDYVRKHVKV